MGSSDSNLTSAAVLGHWIDGQAVNPAADARTAPVYNPATGEVARKVALASTAQVEAAVRSAAAAFAGWAATPPLRRARVPRAGRGQCRRAGEVHRRRARQGL
jgi:acyl-CoA reductase-like NAD-dependent aldehyde dehydrogenase